jgi:flagellar basal body L-ring protein FlgH
MSLYPIAILVLVFILPVTCQAGSIWAKRSVNSKSTYADDKAIQIGDVLTIIISEITNV